ncbi:hypothetical protein GCM10009431_13790 [Gaetbulibacter jejuensis]|uniref:Uncharacterized protein n=1 Tax=Gaetbulibacter jejuensis TaxID=584607 RepID=A0ABN1JL35_9FLAO
MLYKNTTNKRNTTTQLVSSKYFNPNLYIDKKLNKIKMMVVINTPKFVLSIIKIV